MFKKIITEVCRLLINTLTCKDGPDAWKMATTWFDVITDF